MSTLDIRRLKALAAKRKSPKKQNVVSSIRSSEDDRAKNMQLLFACENDWSQLRHKREEHARFVRYMNGQQWDDVVTDPDTGKPIKESELISKTGLTPMQNNVIQQYMRNIIGQMLTNKSQSVVQARRDEDSELGEMLTNTIQACLDLNKSSMLDVNHAISLCSSGVSVGKITFTKWSDKNDNDALLQFVNINRIAWNQDVEDPRLFDIRRITELHSYTIDELISNFATTASDEAALREVYQRQSDGYHEELNGAAKDNLKTLDFWNDSSDLNKCRVIEVWQKLGRWVLWVHDRASALPPKEYTKDFQYHEQMALEENKRRLEQALGAGLEADDVEDAMMEYERYYEEYWAVKYLTPHGDCLLEMETPYNHGQHPYYFALMPLVEGECKSLMSDAIDLQRNLNRERTILEALSAGAIKNTLMVPETAVEGRDRDQYVKELMKLNGVIFYTPKPGVEMPSILSKSSTNLGIWDLLNFDMQQAKEISGLSGALQGQVSKSGTPSSLYAQQAQNSMLNFVLLFDRLNESYIARDEKLLKVLLQYYNRPRHLSLSGKYYASTIREYIPEKAQKIANDYSIVSSQNMDTPAYRMRIDDYLMQMVNIGLPLEIFLEYTTLPFGKKLLAQLKSLREQQIQMQEGEAGIAPVSFDQKTLNEVANEAQKHANPEAMRLLQQAFGRGAA